MHDTRSTEDQSSWHNADGEAFAGHFLVDSHTPDQQRIAEILEVGAAATMPFNMWGLAQVADAVPGPPEDGLHRLLFACPDGKGMLEICLRCGGRFDLFVPMLEPSVDPVPSSAELDALGTFEEVHAHCALRCPDSLDSLTPEWRELALRMWTDLSTQIAGGEDSPFALLLARKGPSGVQRVSLYPLQWTEDGVQMPEVRRAETALQHAHIRHMLERDGQLVDCVVFGSTVLLRADQDAAQPVLAAGGGVADVPERQEMLQVTLVTRTHGLVGTAAVTRAGPAGPHGTAGTVATPVWRPLVHAFFIVDGLVNSAKH